LKRLEVRLRRAPSEERVVGHLAEADRRTYFEYDADFLRDPLWLSPFKLKPEPGLLEHRDRDFGPLFGLFDDSLPDGWGLLLMDRFFEQQGMALPEVSALDRLAFLGTRTMGALTYHPPTHPEETEPRLLDLHEMARSAARVIRGTAEEVLPRLVRAGGSPGGARPKVLVGVRGDELLSGEEDLPEGFTHWMVKFNAPEDPPDAGAIELAYARMARRAGIDMPPTRLFETSEGERFFGVERFDRAGNRRFHVHTFGNLIHANFRIPSCDYRQLLDVTRILTRNHQDVLQCYRRMVFNVLAHNRDDHVKNFAFRMNEGGEWRLAPAYDLMFSHGPGGEHSTTVAGEGRAPGREHLLRLAEPAGIAEEDAESILGEVVEAVGGWWDEAGVVGVGEESAETISRTLAGEF
jgi:serine/threonine-protein kinase HipA